MLASADQQGKPMLARNRQRDSQGENNAAAAGYNKTVYYFSSGCHSKSAIKLKQVYRRRYKSRHSSKPKLH